MDGVPRVKRAILLLTTLLALAGPSSVASAAVPQGVWMVDGKAALQIYDCNGLMCGRLRWLDTPRDARGEPNRDKNTPIPRCVSANCAVLPCLRISIPPIPIAGKAAISTIRNE